MSMAQTSTKLCYELASAEPLRASPKPASKQLVMADRVEIEALFVRWGPMVLRRARAILGNDADAEETAQEVFIRAMRGLDNFEGRSKPSSWLYRITTNLCLNRLRNQKRRKELRDIHLQESPASAGHADEVMMRELLQKVPQEAWARTAVYVYVDGMTHQEAAKLMGVSKRTIGNHLARLQKWVSTQDELGTGLLPKAVPGGLR